MLHTSSVSSVVTQVLSNELGFSPCCISCVLWTVLFVSTYVLVLIGLIATFFLMQMAMKGGGGDDFQNRNKLLSLELLQVLDNHLHITKFLFQFLAFCLPWLEVNVLAWLYMYVSFSLGFATSFWVGIKLCRIAWRAWTMPLHSTSVFLIS